MAALIFSVFEIDYSKFMFLNVTTSFWGEGCGGSGREFLNEATVNLLLMNRPLPVTNCFFAHERDTAFSFKMFI
jgi:hypothetical protein